jgi:hypothetical protein
MSNCPVCCSITGYDIHTCGMVSDCDINDDLKSSTVEIERGLLVDILEAAELSDVYVSIADINRVKAIIGECNV